jgi:hypothetical protein
LRSEEKWRWEFWSFESVNDGLPVQDWFDGLVDIEREEIVDLLAYLQNMTDRLWRRPEFDPLEGDNGISEIRVPDLRLPKQGKVEKITYRIYGFRGPGEGVYTFLHATDKDVKNDKLGKAIARERLAQLRRGDATIRKFDFEGKPDQETSKRAGRPN